jgi:hypothetical protein
MVDMRQLDDVLFHEDHKPRPDIQYDGSERLGESKLTPMTNVSTSSLK